MESGFVRVAKVSEIELGKTKKVSIQDLFVLIVNANGHFYAIDSFCSHYGGDLSEGTLQGNIITCPVHKARFDVTTGEVVSPPAEPLGRENIENLATYLLRIENQEIFIKN